MKKIILLFVALFITISAAHADNGQNQVCTVALAAGVSEAQLLKDQMTTGVSIDDAVMCILDAGGDQGNTWTAALIIDPLFEMPQLASTLDNLPATGAGGDTDNNDTNDDLGDIDLALNDDNPEGDDRLGNSP